MQNNKLFVGGISWNTSEERLKEYFSQIGEIDEVKIITDRMTGKSKGFGFVEFKNEADAQKAIATLDGKELDGRSLKVAQAKPQITRN